MSYGNYSFSVSDYDRKRQPKAANGGQKENKESRTMEKKVVLITGCSSGIGRKLCMILKRKGYFVAASARELSRLDHLDADMKVMLDVSRPETIENAVKEIIERSG